MDWEAMAWLELPTHIKKNTTHFLGRLRGHGMIRTAHTHQEKYYAPPEYEMDHVTIRTAHTCQEEYYTPTRWVLRPQHDQNCPHASRGTHTPTGWIGRQ
jgi:hypothetical protein